MERFANCESSLGGDEIIRDHGDVGTSEKPLAKSLGRTGSAQGAGFGCRLSEAAERFPSFLLHPHLLVIFGVGCDSKEGEQRSLQRGP